MGYASARHLQLVIVSSPFDGLQATYIVERNVRKFDLLQPLQAFHLATIVLRLKATEADLKKRYEDDCKDHRQKPQAGGKDGVEYPCRYVVLVDMILCNTIAMTDVDYHGSFERLRLGIPICYY